MIITINISNLEFEITIFVIRNNKIYKATETSDPFSPRMRYFFNKKYTCIARHDESAILISSVLSIETAIFKLKSFFSRSLHEERNTHAKDFVHFMKIDFFDADDNVLKLINKKQLKFSFDNGNKIIRTFDNMLDDLIEDEREQDEQEYDEEEQDEEEDDDTE